MKALDVNRRLRRASSHEAARRWSPAGEATRESQSLQVLARVLAAARLGEAALLQAAHPCGMEDLLAR